MMGLVDGDGEARVVFINLPYFAWLDTVLRLIFSFLGLHLLADMLVQPLGMFLFRDCMRARVRVRSFEFSLLIWSRLRMRVRA